MKKNESFKKVIFSEYEGKYDSRIIELLRENPKSIDVETMRGCLYGFTFTPEYQAMKYPDELTMDYWSDRSDEGASEWDSSEAYLHFGEKALFYHVRTQQEALLLQAIDSTGDGQTPETALCVIDVGQEYEYMRRVLPYPMLETAKQSTRHGIDCITFMPNIYGIEQLYFDIRRRFEVGYFQPAARVCHIK